MVEFRKRLTEEILIDINELILKRDDDDHQSSSGDEFDESSDTQETNKGTVILDATCDLQNIEVPQDINLLNETRKKLEAIIDAICSRENLVKTRIYYKERKIRLFGLALGRSRKDAIIYKKAKHH